MSRNLEDLKASVEQLRSSDIDADLFHTIETQVEKIRVEQKAKGFHIAALHKKRSNAEADVDEANRRTKKAIDNEYKSRNECLKIRRILEVKTNECVTIQTDLTHAQNKLKMAEQEVETLKAQVQGLKQDQLSESW